MIADRAWRVPVAAILMLLTPACSTQPGAGYPAVTDREIVIDGGSEPILLEAVVHYGILGNSTAPGIHWNVHGCFEGMLHITASLMVYQCGIKRPHVRELFHLQPGELKWPPTIKLGGHCARINLPFVRKEVLDDIIVVRVIVNGKLARSTTVFQFESRELAEQAYQLLLKLIVPNPGEVELPFPQERCTVGTKGKISGG